MWAWVEAADWVHANWLWVVLAFCSGYVIGHHRGATRGSFFEGMNDD